MPADLSVAATPAAPSQGLVVVPGAKVWWRQKRLWFAITGVLFAVWNAWKHGAQSASDFLRDDGVMDAVRTVGTVVGFVGAYLATAKGAHATAMTRAGERPPTVAAVDVLPVAPADETPDRPPEDPGVAP